jgi:two-component system sensor histidine kinase/response regulator
VGAEKDVRPRRTTSPSHSPSPAPYDVAIVDLDMPEMDGMELARAIRADPALASIKLVLLASTRPGEPSDAEAAWQAAIDTFVTKPVRQSPLYNTW